MTVQLRAGRTTEDPRLDWLPPPDQEHVEKYPLRGVAEPWDHPAPVPVVLGINWYEGFYADALVERRNRGHREWWVPEAAAALGRVVGGHCIVLEPAVRARQDTRTWWAFYDQGQEGACVGFGWSRCMSFLNRKRYEARELYWETQRRDPWEGGAYEGATPRYDGTSTRVGADVLRDLGHRPVRRGKHEAAWYPEEGLRATRWAESMGDVLDALGRSGADSVVWCNSWGQQGYPERVHVPCSVLDRVIFDEDGEAGIPTDR